MRDRPVISDVRFIISLWLWCNGFRSALCCNDCSHRAIVVTASDLRSNSLQRYK